VYVCGEGEGGGEGSLFHYSFDFITFFVGILHKFAYSQIKQDGLGFQILVHEEYCNGQTCKMGYN
jgi:hypothetical protein